MIDITIPFTILQVGCVGYCIYKIVRLKKQGKKIRLRIVASSLFPESIVCYDCFRHVLKYIQNHRKGYGPIHDDLKHCMDGKQ